MGAVSLAIHTLHGFGVTIWPFPPVTGLIFGATLASYAYLQWQALYRNTGSRSSWGLILMGSILLGAFLAVRHAGGLPIRAWVILGLAAGLLYGYAFPLPFTGKTLREWPYAKVFLIAMVWTLATALLPLWALSEATFPVPEDPACMPLILGARFLFIVAITLPFDLRDMAEDLREGIRTLPIHWGWTVTRGVALVALGLSLAMETWLLSGSGVYGPPLLSTMVMHGAAGLLLVRARADRGKLYYGFWLDGVLLIPLLIAGCSALLHR